MTSSKKHLSPTIPIIILVIAILFISLTASSMITTNGTLNDEELNEYLDHVIDELTNYISIKNVYGKLSSEKPYHITQIAIMISPLFHDPINISDWIIQVQTTDTLSIYIFNQSVMKQDHHTIFSHPLWQQITPNTFGVMTLIDNDASLLDQYTLSESSDLVFLVFPISNDSMTKGETVTITLSSGTSIRKCFTFDIPFSTRSIVSLY